LKIYSSSSGCALDEFILLQLNRNKMKLLKINIPKTIKKVVIDGYFCLKDVFVEKWLSVDLKKM